ncbi:MAG: type IV pilus secretin PilQ [Elusimicrobia bacterium]|nr:type IV pilus secretin PilQ [Elusimicrobiota bacterium]
MKKTLSLILAASLVGASLPQFPQPLYGETTAPGETSAGWTANLEKIENTEEDTLKITTSQPIRYNAFPISNPPRLVLELIQTRYTLESKELEGKGKWLKKVRSGQYQSDPDPISRIVLDLKEPVGYEILAEENLLTLHLQKDATQSKIMAPDPSPPPRSSSAKAAAPKPAEKKRNLLTSLSKEPVDIHFESTDIRDVLRLLSMRSQINLIYGTDISGTLTLHLNQVPFQEAFHTVLTMKGLVTQQVGDNILRIMTPAILAQERSRAVTFTRVTTINYAKATDIAAHLNSVRSAEGRAGTISVDSRTNSLVITDTPEGLESADRLIAELDRKPQQVMIESKLVDITLTKNWDFGLQWEYAETRQTPSGSVKTSIGQRDPRISAGGSGATLPVGVAAGARGAGVSLPQTLLSQIGAITFGRVTNHSFLTATLSAAADKGNLKILSNPKIITLNNQQAKIQVGDQVPIKTTTVSPGVGTTESVSFVNVGIILTVTPVINADRQVTLNIKPEVSSATADPSGAGPRIATRTAETTVMVSDGETLVIGGLIDETKDKQTLKVPLLGDIPLLGWLFKRTSDKNLRRELLVFVTPKIID